MLGRSLSSARRLLAFAGQGGSEVSENGCSGHAENRPCSLPVASRDGSCARTFLSGTTRNRRAVIGTSACMSACSLSELGAAVAFHGKSDPRRRLRNDPKVEENLSPTCRTTSPPPGAVPSRAKPAVGVWARYTEPSRSSPGGFRCFGACEPLIFSVSERESESSFSPPSAASAPLWPTLPDR